MRFVWLPFLVQDIHALHLEYQLWMLSLHVTQLLGR